MCFTPAARAWAKGPLYRGCAVAGRGLAVAMRFLACARNDREGKQLASESMRERTTYERLGGDSPARNGREKGLCAVIQSEGGLAAALRLQRACAPGNSGQRAENAERRISCVGCWPGGLCAAGETPSVRLRLPPPSRREARGVFFSCAAGEGGVGRMLYPNCAVRAGIYRSWGKLPPSGCACHLPR